VLQDSVALVLSVDSRTAWREEISKLFREMREKIDKEKEQEEKEEKGKEKKRPPAKPSEDPVRDVVTGKLPLLLAGLDAGEWDTFLGAVDVEGLRLVAEDYGDLYETADELKEREVPVLVRPIITTEPYTGYPMNRSARYHRAGVSFAYTLPEDSVAGARRILPALASMARTGLDRRTVLEAATMGGATALGLERSHGSITEGRDADLLFLSGEPLDPTTRIERVMLRGVFVVGEEKTP
jgi:hypothetical protein